MRLKSLSPVIVLSALLAWVPVPAAHGQDAAWTRTREPVVVAGDALAAFDGAPLDDLFVYAYRAGTWEQIPFQFDEVDATGTYTVENGLLDANDELVFMALDLGTQAVPWVWIPDTASHANPRYQIAVSDPLDAGQHGWVYVYRSADLAPTFIGDYVDWDAVAHRLVGTTYVVGFDPAVHPGIETLELNGAAVDLLDRSKIRIGATCIFLPVKLTEEDLVGMAAMDPDIDGPVRVGGGDLDGSSWAYHSFFQLRGAFDLDDLQPDLCPSLTIDSIRLSIDWLDQRRPAWPPPGITTPTSRPA